jgi:hypothetical protein
MCLKAVSNRSQLGEKGIIHNKPRKLGERRVQLEQVDEVLNFHLNAVLDIRVFGEIVSNALQPTAVPSVQWTDCVQCLCHGENRMRREMGEKLSVPPDASFLNRCELGTSRASLVKPLVTALRVLLEP